MTVDELANLLERQNAAVAALAAALQKVDFGDYLTSTGEVIQVTYGSGGKVASMYRPKREINRAG
jgi:hypothetical protein